jgi:hypothetical protein
MRNHAEEKRIESPDSTVTDASAPELKSSGIGTLQPARELVARARADAIEAGQRIAHECGPLDRHERLRIVQVFRRQLIAPRRQGRKRSNRITAAHADWKSGMHGQSLYQKHIPGYTKMSEWRREVTSRRLREAIRSRERRPPKRKETEVL